MESSKKALNDQQKRKMVIKIGGGSGGGIGAVVLLGGALATAALASAFVVRGKGRSSTKDRRYHHQNPPPENNKQSEHDEANTGQELYERTSRGARKEVETDDDAAFLVSTERATLDVKDGVEISGGKSCHIQAGDQILCSISPKKLETNAVSDDGFVIVDEDFPSSEKKLPLECQDQMPEDEKTKVKLIEEVVSNDCFKENKNSEQVCIGEERAERELNNGGEIEPMSCKEAVEVTEVGNTFEQVQVDQAEAEKKGNMELNIDKEELEGFSCGDGEISQEKYLEAVERAKVDLSEDGIGGNRQAIIDSSLSQTVVSAGNSEDGEKTLPPVFESLVIEHKNVDGDEKEGALPTETVIVQEDDQVKYIERKLAEEPEKCDRPDEMVAPEKCQEVGLVGEAKLRYGLSEMIEEKEENVSVPYKNKEKSSYIVHPTPENIPPVLEELISPDETQATNEDGANEGVAETAEESENKSLAQLIVVGQPKEHEDDLEAGDEDSCERKGGMVMEMSSDEAALSDETGESSVGSGDSSTESNWEAVWPAESLKESSMEPQKVKLINCEVEGKIHEDQAVEEGEDHSEIIAEESYLELHQERAEENILRMLKDHPTNSTRRRMVIGTLSLLSSISCSWFFGLSFVKLCLIVFLTMVLSEIHGY